MFCNTPFEGADDCLLLLGTADKDGAEKHDSENSETAQREAAEPEKKCEKGICNLDWKPSRA